MPIPLILLRIAMAYEAMWTREGNPDDYAPCNCCCAEHTHPRCVARVWGGCRSGLPWGS